MCKFFLPLFLITCLLTAEEFSYWDYHPLHVGANAIRVGKAKVKDNPLGGRLYFRKTNTYVNLLVPVTKKSYFFPRIEWNTFTLNWNQNTKFDEDHFYFAQFSLTFFSTELERWRWIVRAEYNLDLEHFNQPRKFALFSPLLWGQYEINRRWNYHIGAFGYTGLEGGQFYPIIGFDYSPNIRWTFLAVFPIDYSIQYKWHDWKFSLKSRPLKQRFRAGKKEPQPYSIFSYSTMGAEANIHFEKHRRFEFEFYLGYNFGGNFYIKNENGKNALY